jgi:hypothetical protein
MHSHNMTCQLQTASGLLLSWLVNTDAVLAGTPGGQLACRTATLLAIQMVQIKEGKQPGPRKHLPNTVC